MDYVTRFRSSESASQTVSPSCREKKSLNPRHDQNLLAARSSPVSFSHCAWLIGHVVFFLSLSLSFSLSPSLPPRTIEMMIHSVSNWNSGRRWNFRLRWCQSINRNWNPIEAASILFLSYRASLELVIVPNRTRVLRIRGSGSLLYSGKNYWVASPKLRCWHLIDLSTMDPRVLFFHGSGFDDPIQLCWFVMVF